MRCIFARAAQTSARKLLRNYSLRRADGSSKNILQNVVMVTMRQISCSLKISARPSRARCKLNSLSGGRFAPRRRLLSLLGCGARAFMHFAP